MLSKEAMDLPSASGAQTPAEGVAESVVDMVVGQARRFAARELDPILFDRVGIIPAEVRQAAADAGLYGLTIEEEYGGLGLSLGDMCQVISELAARDGSFATSVGLHGGLGTRGLAWYGTPGLRDQWLPKLAAGQVVAAFAATEAGAGSDLMAIRTSATPDNGGVRIDGEKCYVTNGGFCGLITALVRSPHFGGARAHSLVCIPRDAPGVEIGPEERKMGLRSSSTVTVHFDGVHLPMENVLGNPGEGMAYAQRVLTWGRTIMASGCVGTARGALEATLEHVTVRKQFGRTIGKFGASRAHVATMAAQLWAMEAMVEYTGIVEARGGSIEALSAASKVFCSDRAFDICDRAIQLHGALGFLNDLGVERLLRDCRVTRIFEGANDVILVYAGTALIAAPDANHDRRVHGQPDSGLEDVAGEWEEVNELLETALSSVRQRYGVKAIRHQLLLKRLARAHIALQASSAAIWRAEGAGEEAKAVARRSVRYLLVEARRNTAILERAEQDATVDTGISDALYGSGRMPEPVRRPLARSTQ